MTKLSRKLLVVALALVLAVSVIACAACKEPTYVLTYKAGEGTGSDVTAEYAEGAEVTLADNGFNAPEGKQFDGWLVEGETSARAAGSKFTMPAKAVTLTAQWKATAAVEPAKTLQSITATYDGTIELDGSLGNGFEVTAYYSDNTSAKVLSYIVGDIDTTTAGIKDVTVSYTEGDVTKTCIVKIEVVAPVPAKVTVTYKSGEGTGADKSVEVDKSSTVSVKSLSDLGNPFTAPQGKAFVG